MKVKHEPEEKRLLRATGPQPPGNTDLGSTLRPTFQSINYEQPQNVWEKVNLLYRGTWYKKINL
jgi:hypothetical protein